MCIPTISSIETALTIFYKNCEIGNAEIIELFGKKSSATVVKLKQLAKNRMNEQGVCSYGLYRVNTRIAYEAWGLDVADLEERLNKLKLLKLQ